MGHNYNFIPSNPSPLGTPTNDNSPHNNDINIGNTPVRHSSPESCGLSPNSDQSRSSPPDSNIDGGNGDTTSGLDGSWSSGTRRSSGARRNSEDDKKTLQNPFEFNSNVDLNYTEESSNSDGDFSNSAGASPSSSATAHSNDDNDINKDVIENYDDVDYDYSSPDNSFIANNLELNNFPLFKKASKSFYNKIISHLKLIQYHPSNFIIKKGAPSKSMYWILKGTVCITSPDGDSVYNELSSGEFFGEIGILFNRPRTANVIAKTKVLLGILTSKDFNVVLKSFPLMERRIRDEAQERLAMLDKKTRHINEMNNSKSRGDTNGKSTKRGIQIDTSHSSPLPPLTPTGGDSSLDKLDATVSIQQFIKNLPIFESLPSNIIHKLALGAEPVTYKPFNYIFYEDDIGADIYFIVSGQVEVIKYDLPKKRDNIIAKLNNGNYFGEMSFLSYLSNKHVFTRSATVRSITNLELIVIRSEFLEKLCKEYPFIIDHMKHTSELRNQSNQTSTPYQLSQYTHYESDDVIDLRNFKLDFNFRPLHSRSASPKKPQTNGNGATESQEGLLPPKLRSQNQSPVSSTVGSNPSASTSQGPTGPPHTGTILTPRPKTLKRSISLNLTPQYTAPSSSFSPPPSDFEYVPHNKRMRLNSVGRRRSSVLAINSHLSDKMLLKIFEYLDLPTLMKLRIICKRWRQLLALCPTLFETLDLTPWNTTLDDKSLIDIVKFVGSRPSHIDISNCFHITDEGFSYMVNEIGISGKIKTLKMRSNWEISAMAIMDLTTPSVGKDLREIDLSNCRKVRDNVLERLIGWNNPASNDNEPQGSFYDDDYDYDEGVGCKNLTAIKVGYCKHLTDRVMHHISDNCNERLTELDLTRCTTITDKGFEYWTYKFFPNLTSLSLKDCTFLTDKSIISIANSVPNLKLLNLNFCCSLTDISVEVLSIGCQQLEVLDLSFCGSAVSDSSLLAVSMNLNLLKKLILKGCIRVTRAGIDSLLSSDSDLSYLDVGQCKNSDFYPGAIPAQKLNVNPRTKSAFVTAGHSNKIIEIVI